MKKIISLFLAFTIIFTLCLEINGVQAAQNTITVNASVDDISAKVTIKGILSGGLNKKVGVIVYNPDNSRIDYMDDQLIENTDGSFSFSYVLERKVTGIYKVNVYGPNSEDNASTTFTYTDAGSGTDNKAPVITIKTENNTTYFKNIHSIELYADAADSDGSISNVEFYANGNKIGEDNSAPYKFTWNSVPSGDYVIKAIAYDNSGKTGESNRISITVLHKSSSSQSNTNTAPSATPTATPTVTPSTTPTATPAPTQKPIQFKDVDKDFDWAREAIEFLSSQGIIKGTGENTFEPAANITRADFVLLIVRVLDLKSEVDDNFSDTGKDDYYYKAVGIAKKLGITVGDSNNNFNPNSEISRQDMMVLCFRALKVSGKLNISADLSILDKYQDRSDIAEYAVNALSAMVNSGFIVGDKDALNPKGNATRAETAVLIYRILKSLVK